nr:EH domain-binding protein 1-like isoform X1 [Odocoileus virginianus texanus]XP_020747269.1 EH domain-binding protein 1-like isoform X1 [Odocoileus virginianus texanus]XP_020747270.1 EH domain-binding protein 1-like isoform X1 [Odocoileus virginianus texanus]XP_020747271.1 EH domain-binding protein 1-like isoform X1 [Odocoileus virginianus texanus]XP_020747272.1 EH domain-binding protein 1-like isoform X1 [Odocoileus virginianus texanus]XP_020747273.1 EH domain-binding protein 1-like isoform
MASVWKRLQRVGKHASKFQFVASYQELMVECTKKWQPDKLVVVWTRRSRRKSSKAHSWQPGIKNPYRGVVVWPVPENIEITVTLFKDPHAEEFEDKEWTFVIENREDFPVVCQTFFFGPKSYLYISQNFRGDFTTASFVTLNKLFNLL